MIYRVLLAITLTFGSIHLSAQDHLEPTNNIFTEYQISYDYHSKLRDVLIKDLPHVAISQLVIVPSFSQEIVWQIQHDRENDKYYSVSVTGTTSIWYNQFEEKPKKIKAIVGSNEIAKETGELIKQLFKAAIHTVRHSPEDFTFGVDGTNYYFSYFSKSGTIWSPRKETKMRQLVDLCNELMNHTSKNMDLTDEQTTDIQNLISDLQ